MSFKNHACWELVSQHRFLFSDHGYAHVLCEETSCRRMHRHWLRSYDDDEAHDKTFFDDLPQHHGDHEAHERTFFGLTSWPRDGRSHL